MTDPPQPIALNAAGIDLSQRVRVSQVVAASPALAAETTICTVTLPANVWQALGIFLFGWCAFTVGTSGVSSQLRIRQTDTSGAIVADTGATTATAAALVTRGTVGLDTAGALPGQVYVLTLEVGSGGAVSTVSEARLIAGVV